MKNFFYKLLYGGGIFFDLCKWLILLVVVLMLVSKFWISFFIVDGISMEPNLHDKEIVLMNRLTYNYNDPNRGDVVVVKYPGDPNHKVYVKRVIGLPKETITIQNSEVLINHKKIDEDYLPFDTETSPDKTWQLEDNEYFLMGDNRIGSNDSRYFGPVEKRFFVGKATRIIYPRFRALEK